MMYLYSALVKLKIRNGVVCSRISYNTGEYDVYKTLTGVIFLFDKLNDNPALYTMHLHYHKKALVLHLEPF